MDTILGLILLIPMLVLMLVGVLALLVSVFTIAAIIYETIPKKDERRKNTR